MGICWTKRIRSTNSYETSKLSAAVAPSSSPLYDFSNRFQLFGLELCPFTARIRIALQHKGITVNPTWLTSQDLKAKTKEWMAPVCPKGKLPVLQHGEKRICGSTDEILEYIETTLCEPPLLLLGSFEKDVKDWVGYVRDTFSPLIEQVLYGKNPYGQQDLETKLHAAFAKLDSGIWEHSKEGPYFMGKDFSLVDVYLIPFLELVHPLAYFRGIEISSLHSYLLGYTKRMVSFPSYVSVKVDIELLQSSAAKLLAEGAPPAVVTVTILQHRSILWHMEKLVELADELAVAKQGMAPVKALVGMKVKKLCKVYGQLVEVMQEHAQMEERVVFPAIEKAANGATEHSNGDHARDLPIMNGIREDIKSVLAIEPGSAIYSEALLALAIRLRTFKAYTTNHFQEEEMQLLPLLEIAGLGSKQQANLICRCMTVMEASHTHLLPYLLLGLQAHEIHEYISTLQKCFENDKKSTFLMRMVQSLRDADEDFEHVWKVVEERIPALAISWSTSLEN
ncbi:hypothetical protein O6H91_04G076300 [Diphasiastrum complanatum]|uniref:Uncharacterized protein n=1 Tax=Diphasiastrum complanatum TaxID=34168 RepID=A0ACC2DY95_DIPCM|nr:hypothetical protein O6H91_04G076300 [Diphasiastrum complanatum]